MASTNPIENLWMVLKKASSKRCPPPKTVSEMKAVIREEWEKFSIEIVQTSNESMPSTVESNKSLKLKDL